MHFVVTLAAWQAAQVACDAPLSALCQTPVLHRTCRTEEPSQQMADSSSPLVKGFEAPMAAVKQAINDAIAELPNESSAGSQTPAASPVAASMTENSGPEPADPPSSEEMPAPMTQHAAVTRKEAAATSQVSLPSVTHCNSLPLLWLYGIVLHPARQFLGQQ